MTQSDWNLVKDVLSEMHKIYKDPNAFNPCSARADLLNRFLRTHNYNSLMWIYKRSEGRKMNTLDGATSIDRTHVVVILDNMVLDSNITNILPREEYEMQMNQINENDIEESNEYNLPNGTNLDILNQTTELPDILKGVI